jgi:hypothetical protein
LATVKVAIDSLQEALRVRREQQVCCDRLFSALKARDANPESTELREAVRTAMGPYLEARQRFEELMQSLGVMPSEHRQARA